MIFNNNIDSRDFLFIFKIENNEDNVSIIIKWLFLCLDKINVSSIYNNYNTNYGYNILIDNSINKDSINILLHLGTYDTIKYKHNYCIVDEECLVNYLKISILDTLFKENIDLLQINVSNIGINGISNKLIKKLWWQYINGYKGYKYYTIYKKYINNWVEVIENSYTFQWENYPPIE